LTIFPQIASQGGSDRIDATEASHRAFAARADLQSAAKDGLSKDFGTLESMAEDKESPESMVSFSMYMRSLVGWPFY
jgi:hypothetical protein